VAATTAGARLTEAHRLAQARLGAQTVRALRAVFPLLDPADIDATFARWLQGVIPIIRSQHQLSARLAGAYMTTFRTLEIGPDAAPFVPVLAADISEDAVTTSMLVTGPVSLRTNLTKAVPLVRALSIAEANSARSGMRHAMNGGRDTIQGSIRTDTEARGWARTTSGRACSFCALLASRGPVYSKTTVDFHAHDGCSCGSEPVYRRDADWPSGSRRYDAIYQDAKRTAQAEGIDVLVAFRRAVEGR
jgi:hypothetical protein